VTQIALSGEEFWIDGAPTYVGRTFAGQRIQGLLFNVRAVQATFDDANPATRPRWAYPDTGEWDAARNTDEFCAALPAWRDHGVLAFTVNFQGGGAIFDPAVYDYYDNNGFTPHGELKPTYAARMERVLTQANALGMAVIVGLFYWKQTLKLENEQAVWRAAHEALDFLQGTGYKNILIEIANETHERFGYDLFAPSQAHIMLDQLRQKYPDFLYATSLVGVNPKTGKGMPPATLVDAVDYVLLHGNGADPLRLESAIQAVRRMPAFRRLPKPIVINEDSPSVQNLDVAWRNGASWGYFDQGFGSGWRGDIWVDYASQGREDQYEALSGYQTPPINWGINTEYKRAFFERVSEVTGYDKQA